MLKLMCKHRHAHTIKVMPASHGPSYHDDCPVVAGGEEPLAPLGNLGIFHHTT